LNHLLELGLSLETVDVRGEWAELNAPQDLARFVLGTKAESLDRLHPLLRHGRIGRQVSFTQEKWQADRVAHIGMIRDTFGDQRVIVRSSAFSEDGWQESGAGAHKSILDVPLDDAAALSRAVDEVFESYRDPRAGASGSDPGDVAGTWR
jgi:glutamine kinase